MKIGFNSLPLEIFETIKDYLLVDKFLPKDEPYLMIEWKNLMNSSKSVFAEVKRNTIYFSLNSNASNEFLDDNLHFYQRVLSLVRHPRHQISLKLMNPFGSSYTYPSTSERLSLLSERFSNIHKLFVDYLPSSSIRRKFPFDIFLNQQIKINPIPMIIFSHYEELLQKDLENIFSNQVVETEVTSPSTSSVASASSSLPLSMMLTQVKPGRDDYQSNSFLTIRSLRLSCFSSLHYLSLLNCLFVSDVSSLGSIYDLNLSGCRNIQDVSSLVNVYRLNLSNCFKVIDISSFQKSTRMYDLNITNCINIDNISYLSNIPILTMIGLTKEITKTIFTIDNTISKLIVSDAKILSSYFGFNRYLHYYQMPIPLSSSTTAPLISNRPGLVTKAMERPTVFGSLQSILLGYHYLTLENFIFEPIDSLSQHQNVKKLILLNCKKVHFYDPLVSLQQLILENCEISSLSTVEDMFFLKHLSIRKCVITWQNILTHAALQTVFIEETSFSQGDPVLMITAQLKKVTLRRCSLSSSSAVAVVKPRIVVVKRPQMIDVDDSIIFKIHG
jgi:hypothetical protein